MSRTPRRIDGQNSGSWTDLWMDIGGIEQNSRGWEGEVEDWFSGKVLKDGV